MDAVIETRGLTKLYGATTAVDRLSLTVRRGEVFGLLGPNGSGKTTTILMLLGLTEPTAGTVRVVGQDPARHPLQVKARVGYLPDSVGFYEELTARENLAYTARLNRIPEAEADLRIGQSLTRMGLAEVIDRPVSSYSHGMKRRLGMADVLIKRPEIIILDEPTLGLDPEAAREFLDMVRELRKDGFTVLLSSHLLHQVQAICDRVGLFRKGVMVLEGTVPELARKVLGGAYRVQVETSGPDVAESLGRIPGAVRVHDETRGRYVVEAERDLRAEVASAVMDAGGRLLSLRMEEPSLDEVYARYFQEVAHAA
ncbi:MAG TPA: ABC transporter ATP-binding protein [Anaerolineales bacterium]